MLYDPALAMIAAAISNYRVQPWYELNGVPLRRILTDPGGDYGGNRELHEFSLYLDLVGIDTPEPRKKVSGCIVSASGFITTSRASFMQLSLGASCIGHCVSCKRMWENRCVRTLRSALAMKSTALPAPWQTYLDSKALAFENQLDRAMPTSTVAA